MKRFLIVAVFLLAGLILFSISYSHNQEISKSVSLLRGLGVSVNATDGWQEYLWKSEPTQAFTDLWGLKTNGPAIVIALRKLGIDTVRVTEIESGTGDSKSATLKIDASGTYVEVHRETSERN